MLHVRTEDKHRWVEDTSSSYVSLGRPDREARVTLLWVRTVFSNCIAEEGSRTIQKSHRRQGPQPQRLGPLSIAKLEEWGWDWTGVPG